MTIRPEDYGDQYPSDSGDTTQPDLTSGMSEVDYSPRIEARGFPAQQRRQFVPSNLESIPPLPLERDVYIATVHDLVVDGVDGNDTSKWPRYFKVLRQDMQFEEKAQIVQHLKGHKFQVGDQVLLIRGNTDKREESDYNDLPTVDGQWFIFGVPWKEMLQYFRAKAADTTLDASGSVPLSVTQVELPSTLDFIQGQRCFSLDQGGIKYSSTKDTALVRIDFTVTLEIDDPDDEFSLTDLTEETDADDIEYVLGKNSSGCMVWVPVEACS